MCPITTSVMPRTAAPASPVGDGGRHRRPYALVGRAQVLDDEASLLGTRR